MPSTISIKRFFLGVLSHWKKEQIYNFNEILINKGLYGTNHGLFRQLKTFKAVADCQVSYS